MPQIIATLGPSTVDPENLKELYKQGVRLFRFNFTHETKESIIPKLAMIKNVEKEIGAKFHLMMDIEGPSIRTGIMEQPRLYQKGELFKMVIGKTIPENNDIWCDYPGIVDNVNIGMIIKIESGLFDAVVRKKGKDYILLEALNDFKMRSKRHINLPGIHTNLETITTKDKRDIMFAQKKGFNSIAISFCRDGKDIRDVRKLLEKNSQIKLIAKIENQEGLDNIDEIIDASDMVMVARGDLGTELPLEKIPEIQMDIVKRCKIKNTPVIIATQLLSSMVKSPAPTRAEVSDIFLAIIQGADYLMLSEETTIGKYPLESVRIINKVIGEVKNGR